MKYFAVILALTLPAGVVSADVVHLKSGGKLEGRVLSNDADGVLLETMTGKVTITPGQIESVDTKHTSELERYYEKRVAIEGKSDARPFLELALWVRDHQGRRFVKELARKAAELVQAKEDLKDLMPVASAAAGRLGRDLNPFWERVVSIDPSNEKARRMLGFRLHEGKWLTNDEYQAAQGNVKYRGQWISREEFKLILKERELKLTERLAEVKRREKNVEAAEQAIKRMQRDIEAMRRDLEAARASLAERERAVKEREEEFRRFTYCRGCRGYYSGPHICSKKWSYCRKCTGYFGHGHKCP